MTSNPRIRVRKATQADVPDIIDIHFTAFDDNIMNKLMYPNGPSEETKAKFGANIMSQPAKADSPEKAATKGENLVFVAEYLPEGGPADGPGEVVAIAKWTLYRQQRPEEEWKAEDFRPTVEAFGEGCNLEVIDEFIGEMNRKQRDHAKGEAALFLGMLATRPNRQRLGAGAALLKHGLDLADSLGLPVRLEASPVGYGLYKKYGFEDIDVLDNPVTEKWGAVNKDGSNWGANNAVALAGKAPEGVMRTVLMRRPPKKPSA